MAGGMDGSVWVWDRTTGQRRTGPFHHAGLVRAVALDPTGGLAVSAGTDGFVAIWNLKDDTHQLLRAIKGRSTGWPSAPRMAAPWSAPVTTEPCRLLGSRHGPKPSDLLSTYLPDHLPGVRRERFCAGHRQRRTTRRRIGAVARRSAARSARPSGRLRESGSPGPGSRRKGRCHTELHWPAATLGSDNGPRVGPARAAGSIATQTGALPSHLSRPTASQLGALDESLYSQWAGAGRRPQAHPDWDLLHCPGNSEAVPLARGRRWKRWWFFRGQPAGARFSPTLPAHASRSAPSTPPASLGSEC